MRFTSVCKSETRQPDCLKKIAAWTPVLITLQNEDYYLGRKAALCFTLLIAVDVEKWLHLAKYKF